LLGLCVVSPSLHGYIVSSNALCHSSKWKFRDEIEWSIDVETEVFAHSFNLRTLGFIKINNLPLLMFLVIVTQNTNL
jgi:hypothetical protein